MFKIKCESCGQITAYYKGYWTEEDLTCNICRERIHRFAPLAKLIIFVIISLLSIAAYVMYQDKINTAKPSEHVARSHSYLVGTVAGSFVNDKGDYLTTGNSNVFLGYNAGYNVATGSANITGPNTSTITILGCLHKGRIK